jgi:hypothetical protein
MSSSAHVVADPVVTKQETISSDSIIHAFRCHVNIYSVGSSYVQCKVVLRLCSEYFTLHNFTCGPSDSHEILLSYVRSVEKQEGTMQMMQTV